MSEQVCERMRLHKPARAGVCVRERVCSRAWVAWVCVCMCVFRVPFRNDDRYGTLCT